MSDRDVILARRRLLMASAVAGLALAQPGCEKKPQPCLSVEVVRDGDAPMPCLSAPLARKDAGSTPGHDADAAAEAAAPRPCLEVEPAPKKP